MSYTEIYKFDKKGELQGVEDIHNSWRGAQAIWRAIEKKYLGYLPKPYWLDQKDYDETGYSRCSLPFREKGEKKGTIQEIWDVCYGDKISRIDEIVLGSTFDRVTVKRKNIPELLEAFRSFEYETSLKEQAKAIEDHYNSDDEMIAIAWNQTSVCCAFWTECNYVEGSEEEIPPYNYLNQDKHWDLFSALNPVLS